MQFPFQNGTGEDTHSVSHVWSSETTRFPSSEDTEEYSSSPSTPEKPKHEQDFSVALGESDTTKDEMVSSLQQRVAQLMAEKEELKTTAEAQQAQV